MFITKLNYNQLENFNSRKYTVPILWHGSQKVKKEFEKCLLKCNLKITFGGRLYNISGLHSKVDAMSFFTKHYLAWKTIINFMIHIVNFLNI